MKKLLKLFLLFFCFFTALNVSAQDVLSQKADALYSAAVITIQNYDQETSVVSSNNSGAVISVANRQKEKFNSKNLSYLKNSQKYLLNILFAEKYNGLYKYLHSYRWLYLHDIISVRAP